MTTPDELFELRVTTDNPMFEGFALRDAPSVLGNDSLDEDVTPGHGTSHTDSCWSQPSLQDLWVPPPVGGRVVPFNDFPGLDMVLPAFSKRACHALNDFLEPNGELLPLQSEVGEYFFYNVTTVVDALDVEASVIEFWCDPPTSATSIDYFAFHRERLSDLSIFRIHQWPMGTIVTDAFVRRVYEHGLNGFDFLKIWPLERGTLWETQATHVEQLRPSRQYQQHTLVLRFPLAAKKPSTSERRVLSRLEDELDAQLVVTSRRDTYFGSYEGNDVVDHEFRMFLSCPDADRLVSKLQPWLAALVWIDGFEVVKRYGNITDTQAAEVIVAM